MDGIVLPGLMVTHTRTHTRARHALIDSEKMDLDVRKLWDASKNLQESDNPLLAGTRDNGCPSAQILLKQEMRRSKGSRTPPPRRPDTIFPFPFSVLLKDK